MNETIQPGSNVSIVFYVDGKPIALSGVLKKADPFTVRTTGEGASHLREGRRAMLVVQNGREFSKAEAELHSDTTSDGWEVVAKSFGWETVDRRRYPRFEVGVPILIRAVTEAQDGPELTIIEGTTEDLSIGGAWVKSKSTLPTPSLVEVTVQLHGGPVRALSLVKWADSQGDGIGFGVEFLDFVEGSRYALHQFLNTRAA